MQAQNLFSTGHYADIALGLPSALPFQYEIPDSLIGKLQLGQRVWVRVRERKLVGYIVAFSEEKGYDQVKAIDSLIDEKPLLDAHFLDLSHWISERYFCSQGQAIEAILPAPFKKGRFLMKSRAKKISETAESVNPTDLALTPFQEEAYRRISEKIQAKKSAVFLLHGITGSGKTEVYMHVIRDLLKESRGSIMLVPEISLTPQTVDRFYSRFGDCLAVIHSRLPQGRRVEEWHRIRSGKARVVVGARSAVFSPVQNLGLIVIDEEHDTSYKQGETPRYHAREVAAWRTKAARAVLLLGGATPSLESYFSSETPTQVFSGKPEICRLELPERIEKRPLPQVEIVDMRRPVKEKRDYIFSPALESAVIAALEKKEQVMLLLNRRGFSTHLHCNGCGYVVRCENCRISMAYHFDKSILLCHLCEFRMTPERLCPSCRKSYLHYFGIGTQKVYEEAHRLFPAARLERMDTDSTKKKDGHELILRSFKRGDIDILIGTQMIAKGHDFPNVSLIGVISADTALHIPDFRASERTFALLTQVAGRAGRGDIPGKVIIQTHVPHHYSIQSAKDHNYLEFYNQEIEFRRELNMPPHTHLVRVVFSSLIEKEVIRQILVFAKTLELKLPQNPAMKILGPAPALVSREKGQFHWNFYLKGPDVFAINALLRQELAVFKKSRVTISVDVDPQ